MYISMYLVRQTVSKNYDHKTDHFQVPKTHFQNKAKFKTFFMKKSFTSISE